MAKCQRGAKLDQQTEIIDQGQNWRNPTFLPGGKFFEWHSALQKNKRNKDGTHKSHPHAINPTSCDVTLSIFVRITELLDCFKAINLTDFSIIFERGVVYPTVLTVILPSANVYWFNLYSCTYYRALVNGGSHSFTSPGTIKAKILKISSVSILCRYLQIVLPWFGR